ncbi:MAG: 4-hydroxythreonine-4-phosphate dehydrogenase PdxA [Pseudomonadota bacterium]
MTATAPLAITMGDPAGVGTEITLAAWRAQRAGTALPPFFLIDDPARVRDIAAAQDSETPVAEITQPADAVSAFAAALPVLAQDIPGPITPGRPAPEAAIATIAAIDRAVALARSGAASGVVTNPINKKVLYDGAGFAYPGHTEYLAHLGGVPRTVMMLAVPGLRVVPVTIHIPLAEVPGALTPELLADTARITHAALIRDFGIAAPRLACAGLNPHAGEGGAMGREDIEVIAPVLETLRAEGIAIAGPLPADTMFHPDARARYDVALTMYHDQGLVPIKTLDFARGVNVTLGLPFVRTSPDHGTAYDIAGTGRADPSSLIEAIRLAGEMATARHARAAA